MKEYALSILLLTQVAQHYDSSVTSQSAEKSADSHAQENGISGSVTPENESMYEVFSGFFTLLTSLDRYPDALSLVWLPVFER